MQTAINNILVSLHNVNVKFGAAVAIEALNLNIGAGRHLAVTGKSGSGKSVLLQVIAGNIGISSGKILYNFAVDDESAVYDHHSFIAFAGGKHHFKTLSNTTSFYYQQRYNSSDSDDALTVTQYLETVRSKQSNSGYWTLEKVIDALMLNHLADKEVIKLSNGETRRLMIAAALMKSPSLLLLDNPLSGLDAATRVYFNQLISEIAESGITIIMAAAGADLPDVIMQVAVLDSGRLSKLYERKDYDVLGLNLPNTPVIDEEGLKALCKPTTAEYTDIVKMQNVNIRYGDKQVLRNINWHIKPGDRWALLGPNGAGKSTLLSLINGDNPQAYANEITLFDKKRGTGESIWDIKSKIGFVSPELYQYFPADNSCLQVIESGYYDTLGLFRPSSPGKAQQASQWMKTLEIDQYARKPLKNIPASAQRLCLLARALIKNPPLLIFDEPCQGLDDHQQAHFKAVVDAICAMSSVTLVYVTHYQHEIPNGVNKVLRLEKGEAV